MVICKMPTMCQQKILLFWNIKHKENSKLVILVRIKSYYNNNNNKKNKKFNRITVAGKIVTISYITWTRLYDKRFRHSVHKYTTLKCVKNEKLLQPNIKRKNFFRFETHVHTIIRPQWKYNQCLKRMYKARESSTPYDYITTGWQNCECM